MPVEVYNDKVLVPQYQVVEEDPDVDLVALAVLSRINLRVRGSSMG